MGFNTFRIRFSIALLLAAPSYTLLFLIRGYDMSEMTLYAHAEYSAAVLIILILLFEFHHRKSNWLEKNLSWKRSVGKRLWTELGITVLVTPAVVTPVMYLLYQTLWNLNVWFPGLLEYNLFALAFSLLMGVFVNAEVILEEWKTSLLENEVLEKENARARLSVLQAQISPHFLFNNFNVLGALIEEDANLARKYLEALSTIYRYVLNQRNEELVRLRDEVDFIEQYLFLLSIRFDDQLICKIDVNGHGGNWIPPATLQILVENAIKHNEISTRKPLSISIRVLEGKVLEVRNRLQPKAGSSDSPGVGLNNIANRYRYFTREEVDAGVQGEDFVVTLPLLNIGNP